MSNANRYAHDVFVVGGARIPFVKSWTHYKNDTAQDLMTAALKGVVDKFNLQGQQVGDVGLGALMTDSSDWNLARECVQSAGLDPYTPGFNLQRACGTSLETTLQIANKISLGQIADGIAGGVDTNSAIPAMASRSLSKKLIQLSKAKSLRDKLKILVSMHISEFKPRFPVVVEPRTGKSMGQHTELMVQEWKIGQKEQDELAYNSHKNAEFAYQSGFYDDLLIAYNGLNKDALLRPDTSIEALSKLRPAFDKSDKGTLTAGNSTALTDGAAAVLLSTKENAQTQGWLTLARFVDAEVAGIDYVSGEGLLMAPTIAVSRLLKRNNLNLQDFDFYEIHEAFAGQVLTTLKAWESDEYAQRLLGRDKALGAIDRSKLNVKGGSVALGHPFAATGARIVAALAKILHENGKGRGLISICTAGGMGVAAILDLPQDDKK